MVEWRTAAIDDTECDLTCRTDQPKKVAGLPSHCGLRVARRAKCMDATGMLIAHEREMFDFLERRSGRRQMDAFVTFVGAVREALGGAAG